MKNLFFSFALLFVSIVLNAQVTNSVNIPNTGADITTPPAPSFTMRSDNLSNPSNSTVPGANGSYSVDPGKPNMLSPNTNTFSTFPNGTPSGGTNGTTTFSPQINQAEQKENEK